MALVFVVMVFMVSGCTKEDKRSLDAYDDAVKNSAGRAREFTLRQNLQLMRDAVQVYIASEGHYPGDLDELARQGAIDHIPADPFGKGYDYNPANGSIKSRARPSF